MKYLFKLLTILTLACAVFVFSLYCCCLIHPALASQVTEEAPCHQTEHKQSPSQGNQECHCHHDLVGQAKLEKTDLITLSQSFFVITPQRESLNARLPIQIFAQRLPESPPRYASAAPLYIKHASFRI